jgi:hypothetical protein
MLVHSTARGLLLPLATLVLAGCQTGTTVHGTPPQQPTTQAPADVGSPSAAAPASSGPGPPAVAGRVSKVLTIVMENHGAAAAMAQMPTLRDLAHRYGYTSHYAALAHQSLPNYIAMAGGSTMGVEDDEPPSVHRLRGPSVFDQALSAGRTAKTYAEGMPTSCAVDDAGGYVVHHNPWAYFADDASRRACAEHDVPAGSPGRGALHHDIASGELPNIGMVVPDLCHDGHDCALSVADSWLSHWMSELTTGPDWSAGRLAVVITFDEAEPDSAANTVLTVVAAPVLHGKVVPTSYTHLAWSAWMSALAGGRPLRDAARSPSLATGFGL